MRIFSFEKNRSVNVNNNIIIQPKEQPVLQPVPSSARMSNGSPGKFSIKNKAAKHSSQTSSIIIRHRKDSSITGSFMKPSQNHSPSSQNKSASKSRPMSSFGIEISEQKKKLMQETRDIRRSINQNKSLIEAARLKKKAE